MRRNLLAVNMSDRIRLEERVAVEASPAPPHPRPDSAAVSREPAGGSPCEGIRDEIDELVDASLNKGPQRPHMDRCPHCEQEWHGKPNRLMCQGSHLSRRRKRTRRPKPAVVRWDQMGGNQ